MAKKSRPKKADLWATLKSMAYANNHDICEKQG